MEALVFVIILQAVHQKTTIARLKSPAASVIANYPVFVQLL